MSRREGRPVVRSPKQVRLHRALEELGWTGEIGEFNAAARLKNQFVPEPILITTNGTILVGFGRWRSALFDDRHELNCIEYPLSEEEALQFIISHHQPQSGWNKYIRICMALKLEPYFQQRARDNMRAGGKYKGSSKLTEAQRVDVRSEVASAAGVSVGNVSKVKQLTLNANAVVLQALRSGEISIHRASLWMNETHEKQYEMLKSHRSERGIRKTVRTLVSKHIPKCSSGVIRAESLLKTLSVLTPTELSKISVGIAQQGGNSIFLTEQLARTLESQSDLEFTSHQLANKF
jgi:hypothetical protein